MLLYGLEHQRQTQLGFFGYSLAVVIVNTRGLSLKVSPLSHVWLIVFPFFCHILRCTLSDKPLLYMWLHTGHTHAVQYPLLT